MRTLPFRHSSSLAFQDLLPAFAFQDLLPFAFQDLLPALRRGGKTDSTEFSLPYYMGLFYFYSFIFLHYFVLLNMVIAIVVDAYMEVKGDQQSRTVSLLKQNMGTLSENISSDLRRLTLSLLVFFRTSRVYSLLFPHRKHERHFVPWSDAVWTQATRHRRH